MSVSRQTFTVFPSAARLLTANSADFYSNDMPGLKFYLNITAAANNPTLDIKIQARDHVSGVYFDIPGAAFAQKTGAGASELVIRPMITVVANAAVSQVAPRQWRAVATIAGGPDPSITFSLSAESVW